LKTLSQHRTSFFACAGPCRQWPASELLPFGLREPASGIAAETPEGNEKPSGT
jgi:hypothetical protein